MTDRKFIYLSLCFILTGPVIKAIEVPEPYILSQEIPNIPVEQHLCVEILQAGDFRDDLDADQRIMDIEQEMQSISSEYDVLNEEIANLEGGGQESLDWAQIQLEDVIDMLYQEYSLDEDFINLDEESKYQIIVEDENTINWLDYIEQMENELNQLIARRSQLESDYLNLSYELDNMKSEEINKQSTRDHYNQCQLYSYSNELYPVDQILLNPQLLLNDYLVQVDTYLKEIIPKAYRKVAFSDIYRIFSQYTHQEDLVEILSGKTNIVLDTQALDLYSYAKELSLVDIQTIAEFAQYQYWQTLSLDNYQSVYQDVLQLKEAQWNYIYQVNHEALNYMSQELASYLNNKALFTEEDIQLVRALHLRYQTKLVVFNDDIQAWEPLLGSQSGYLEEYLNQNLKPHDDLNEESEEGGLFDDDENNSQEESILSDADIQESVENVEKEDLGSADSIKDRLAKNRAKTERSSLPVPDKFSKKKKPSPKEKQENSTGKDKNTILPTTGETRTLTLIALVMLILGVAIVVYNFFVRKKYRQQLDEIELD